MKNKKILAAVAYFALSLPSLAYSQATSFSGWSLGFNAESVKTTTTPLNAMSDSGTSVSLSLQPQYTWTIGNNFVLGTGLTIGLGDNKAGVFTAGTEDTAIRARLSFDLQPGYVFSNSLLGYLKLSSSGATFEVTSPGRPGVSTTVSGAGYGIGLRAMVSKGLYVQAEYDAVKYNRVLGSALWDIGVDANVFSLGLGMKF